MRVAGAWLAASTVVAAALPAGAQTPPFPGTTAPSFSISPGEVTEGGYTAPWPEADPVRLNTSGDPFSLLLPPPTQQGPGWSITPSLGVQLSATDNLYQTRRDRKKELITTISPGVLVTVDTMRLQGVVSYDPQLQFYASQSDQNGINHNFNGQMLLTLVPDTFFLDLRGSAAVQAANGGFSPSGNDVLSRGQEVQTSSFQISPYAIHRFGGLATVQVGYALQHVSQDSIGSQVNVPLLPGVPRNFSDQRFTANEIYGVVRTGEDFGRVALEGRGQATEYDGTGVLDNAYRRLIAVEGRYAINRYISLLGEIGYEAQRYSGFPPFEISEALWSVGTKLTLSEDSSVTVRYGHHGGFNSARVDAALALGGRTRLYANYAEELTTGSQRVADLLSTTSLDALGNPVDTATGAPVLLPFANALLGVQTNLMRVRSASASVSQDWGRDIFTLTAFREEREPVSVEIGGFAERSRGSSASFSWSHELTRETSASAYVQYGKFDNVSFGSGDVYSLGLTLITRFTPNLAGTLQFVTSSRGDDVTSGRAIQNTIIAGLRQTF
ncbi:TIGR03016 family PEP-CTERM system-associated outer membrane protein [Roseomonas marmotae]|uniref:TIGR03016 family PEP-CTERM system-associated outer membrane protein n=1 Tax=Roseomonas marmotae TaxID=2768161 RepID=A0ABS3KH23_9PROT|nr:TIGR03016 family PEP-CTERM system-associated outer membrane protein [Roseomonas marmotae]MBO1076783.1 TIGR03016 family PEP-CTERM system-associated outer membrane protein [Roseomonas marmotae]QTI78690.1 TIGR03016 family PEP-CTERM system-associated outer membrane protein [Roseomonas marmotae]